MRYLKIFFIIHSLNSLSPLNSQNLVNFDCSVGNIIPIEICKKKNIKIPFYFSDMIPKGSKIYIDAPPCFDSFINGEKETGEVLIESVKTNYLMLNTECLDEKNLIPLSFFIKKNNETFREDFLVKIYSLVITSDLANDTLFVPNCKKKRGIIFSSKGSINVVSFYHDNSLVFEKSFYGYELFEINMDSMEFETYRVKFFNHNNTQEYIIHK